VGDSRWTGQAPSEPRAASHQTDPARRPGVHSAFLDADDFKRVNDNHGHAAGDHVLRLIGGRQRPKVRSGGCIARSAMPSRPEVPVTVSMGAVTYVTPPPSVRDLFAAL